MDNEHYILNEKYRPNTLEGYVCSDELRNKIETWIEEQTIPHLGLFSKSPGSGKTTLAKILVKNIDCDYLYLNAADKRSMDDIREEILPFVSTMSFKDAPKIVILDEFTSTLQNSQILLLNIIETYSKSTRFILTGNYPERLIEPLRSRLEEYELKPPSKNAVYLHIINILKKEKIKASKEDLVSLINSHYPDIRKIINTCQKHTSGDSLSLPSNISTDEEIENKIIALLKKPNKNTWKEIRVIVAENNISNFDSLYRRLYSQLGDYSNGNSGLFTVIINEHIVYQNQLLDKEICFMSCISKIIDSNKPQIL